MALALTLTACGDDSTGSSTSSPAATNAVALVPKAGACAKPPSAPTSAQTFEKAPDKSRAAGKTFTGTIHTNCGDIVVDLYGDKAPQTVASFMQLAEKAYWKDSPCHRLTTSGIYVLQCGSPMGTPNGNPGYGYGVENAPEDSAYPGGTLAMARTSDPNSNGGQFFIVYDDTVIDDPTGVGYSIFGRVTKGMDIVAKIAKAGVDGGGQEGPPAQPISILSVAVTEKKA
ncbi:peptidylprolyl isomerase [Luteipulveratus mongoliensis]|uniref:Peptidylprolyl isomerase n=2 Tax=Luteipulveratus mongoliensis TaxID=571913 RepID=A0A0K1JQG6_9MICO|nr:peptidylprolyl isomerase [Luteipulveratus mongoliensis]